MTNAIICGMEHSGTTLVSDLVRQTGAYESGFEIGVLLEDSPKAFSPAGAILFKYDCGLEYNPRRIGTLLRYRRFFGVL